MIILVASGKGGVGKSTVSAALGESWARLGEKVCLVDADIGLRSLDALLGLENSVVYDLLDVTGGGCALEQALLTPSGAEGLSLLPAAQFARAKELEPKALCKVVKRLEQRFDRVVIDCPAGLEKGLRNALALPASQVLLMCTPDDVCVRDAERVAQLCERKGLPRPELIVNRLMPALIESGEMPSAAAVAQAIECPLAGEVPEDLTLYRALLRHIRPMDAVCGAAEALERIARRLKGEEVPLPGYGTQKKSWLKKLFSRPVKEVKTLDR